MTVGVNLAQTAPAIANPSITLVYTDLQSIQTNQVIVGIISSILEILFGILLIVGFIGAIIEGAKDIWKLIHGE